LKTESTVDVQVSIDHNACSTYNIYLQDFFIHFSNVVVDLSLADIYVPNTYSTVDSAFTTVYFRMNLTKPAGEPTVQVGYYYALDSADNSPIYPDGQNATPTMLGAEFTIRNVKLGVDPGTLTVEILSTTTLDSSLRSDIKSATFVVEPPFFPGTATLTPPAGVTLVKYVTYTSSIALSTTATTSELAAIGTLQSIVFTVTGDAMSIAETGCTINTVSVTATKGTSGSDVTYTLPLSGSNANTNSWTIACPTSFVTAAVEIPVEVMTSGGKLAVKASFNTPTVTTTWSEITSASVTACSTSRLPV